MSREPDTAAAGSEETPPRRLRKKLAPAARRALEEAEARRKAFDAEASAQPAEIGGRGGKDPARYGDWEVKGIASDF